MNDRLSALRQLLRPRFRADLTRSRSLRFVALATAIAFGVNLLWSAGWPSLVSARSSPHDWQPSKSISLKTALPPDAQLPEPKPMWGEALEKEQADRVAGQKVRPQAGQKGINGGDRPTLLAQSQTLEERGRLERGDRTLDDGSYYDLYEIDARAGQEIRIELTSSDFDTYLILVDSNGQPIAENDDRSRSDTNSVLEITLETDGEYRILANSYDSRGRGSYTLRVFDLSADVGPQPNGNTGDTGKTGDTGDTGNTGSSSNPPRPVSLTAELSLLAQADRLYLQGDVSGAEALYRQAKPDFLIGANPVLVEERIDASQLSLEASQIWLQTQEEIARDRESRVEDLWPQLISAAPGFVDGQLFTAEYLIEENEEEMVIEQLDELALRFPNDAEIARLHVKALREDRQRLEASIAARQFALANPEHPDAPEFNALADEYMGDFRRVLRERIALQGLGGVAIGILTGRTNSAIFDGIQLAQLMAMGESGIGDFVTNQVKAQSKIIDDPEAVEYMNKLGQDVAQRMGRDEFDYEFYIIEDESLNAFALPGGKVFIHTGALAAAKTEAELVGLLGHEVGHAVLSHGFKRIVRGQLIASLAREIPLGNVLYTLVGLDYSREHERQSDIVGTRVLANTGYAADGLRNFMATLGGGNPQRVPEYLSTHPAPASRVQYLEELVVRNGYNRYSFEGVENLARIQARLGLPAHEDAA